MLEGTGYYKGSSIMVSGGPGTGKTSLGRISPPPPPRAANVACIGRSRSRRRSWSVTCATIGIDLRPAIDEGTGWSSRRCGRPAYGLEMHLASMLHDVQELKPDVVVIDPLSALQASGSAGQSGIMVLRLIDFLKSAGATALYLNVQAGDGRTELKSPR